MKILSKKISFFFSSICTWRMCKTTSALMKTERIAREHYSRLNLNDTSASRCLTASHTSSSTPYLKSVHSVSTKFPNKEKQHRDLFNYSSNAMRFIHFSSSFYMSKTVQTLHFTEAPRHTSKAEISHTHLFDRNRPTAHVTSTVWSSFLRVTPTTVLK